MYHDPLGSVHGGWYATLLDSAPGCAVHTALDAGQAYTTAELGIHIVRAASTKSGRCARSARRCTCRQLATAEARIVGADGKLLRAQQHHLPGVRAALSATVVA